MLNTKQAATQIGLKPNTLAKWRCEGGGPVFFKVGRSVRYRLEDLSAWLAEKRSTSTSQLA